MIWPAACHYSEQNVVNGILICAGGAAMGSEPRPLSTVRILGDFFTGCFP
jgi:hypothetical protein